MLVWISENVHRCRNYCTPLAIFVCFSLVAFLFLFVFVFFFSFFWNEKNENEKPKNEK